MIVFLDFCSRLHYNPVMDEWLSLTEEVEPRQDDDGDILFDLHKIDGPGTYDDNEEILKVGSFLEVSFHFYF